MIALFGDIHSNLQALEACLDDARNEGVTQHVFLGDFVGYGGDPDAVLTQIMALCASGSIAVKGNHDDMASDFDRDMNPSAARAAKWTRAQLTHAQRAFLDGLPLTCAEDDRLYVHSDASAPTKWRYVTDCDGARLSLMATQARLVFCGHVHQPCVYGLGNDNKMTSFVPEADCAIPLLPSRRWQVVVPSTGQPRDGNSLAGYALYDPKTRHLTMRRVPYDIDLAAQRIRAAGLPDGLAERLFVGR